ncbi:MAG: hypothetical protein KC609_24575 [Myxococcales bacterium]|nr:hypothetical protein [Myxococcales bacterium]
MRGPLLERLDLQGLELAPSQVWGAVRIVPLLRRGAPGDLRLAKRSYAEDWTLVRLDGAPGRPGTAYLSYVPHGFVVSWSDDGTPVAAFGASVYKADGKAVKGGPSVRLAHRMVRREQKNSLRLLPLHLALEGFLSLHFGGPEIAWAEYSRSALSRGLSPRSEESYTGYAIAELDDALRLFEIHDDQVGSLLFVDGALGAAFVVSHPEDYRALHRTLLLDMYPEVLLHYARLAGPRVLEAGIEGAGIRSLGELRSALDRLRGEWASFHRTMAAELLEISLNAERVYRAGPFQLQRFITSVDPKRVNHVGEAILRQDGTIEYLKTYRLSAAQTRRAFLLSQLAMYNWNLQATASALRQSTDELIERLDKAGFGYLLKPHVIEEARRRRR